MSEMVRRDILPAVIRFAGETAGAMTAKTTACPGLACAAEKALLERISGLTDELYARCGALDEAVASADACSGRDEQAHGFRRTVLPAMRALRESADALEDLVSKDAWPYPSYGRLLYRV